MGMPDLFLEHKKNEKVQKYLRVKADRDMFVIGSSRDADLRLTGEGVSGCHAVLRFRAPHWYVCDVSGTESVRVNEQLVTEALVDGSTKIEIAGHRLQLFAKERTQAMFAATADPTKEDTQLALHQVVVRSRGRILETHVLKATEAFRWTDGETSRLLPSPTTGEWIDSEFGKRSVHQRLVGAQEMAEVEALELDRDLKKPLALALIFLMSMISIIMLIGHSASKTEVALDNKSLDMIFNAKMIKQKRVESQKVTKVAKARAGGTSEAAPTTSQAKSTLPEESQAPKISGKATAALTSLRQSGLGSLIGKIAKRANKQGIMVAAVGVAPDVAGSGRALFSTGTTLNGGGGSASKQGSYKLGGIATKGKAGGVGNFKDGTALSGGTVGAGNVLALSDDEETSIEGGLDRDAIAEVIKRNLGQIRYCYERQLSSNPDLYGKVLVKFTIGADGGVATQKVDGSTLKSDMVEGCILRRLASWKFPLPKGGTQVRVSYPFLFKALE